MDTKKHEEKAKADAMKEHPADGQPEYLHHGGQGTAAVHAAMHKHPMSEKEPDAADTRESEEAEV